MDAPEQRKQLAEQVGRATAGGELCFPSVELEKTPDQN
jgi:hypothetical protein